MIKLCSMVCLFIHYFVVQHNGMHNFKGVVEILEVTFVV
jgi:hypothetical protein